LPENESWKVRRSQIWPTASVLEHSSRARTMSGVGLTMGRVPYRLRGGTIWLMRAITPIAPSSSAEAPIAVQFIERSSAREDQTTLNIRGRAGRRKQKPRITF